MYHGWSDGGSDGSISALSTVSYYESVLKHMGRKQDDWFIFYGSRDGSLRGRSRPHQFNKLARIESWLEQNEPPESIIATRLNERGVIDMTRPIYPYRQQAVYKGSGSTNDAENFTCNVSGT